MGRRGGSRRSERVILYYLDSWEIIQKCALRISFDPVGKGDGWVVHICTQCLNSGDISTFEAFKDQ